MANLSIVEACTKKLGAESLQFISSLRTSLNNSAGPQKRIGDKIIFLEINVSVSGKATDCKHKMIPIL